MRLISIKIRRMVAARQNFYVICIICALFILSGDLIIIRFYDYWVEKTFFEKYYKNNGRITTDVKVKGCKIPLYSPFDSTIKKYVNRFPPLKCKETQPPLLKFHNDLLWFDENVLEKLGTRPQQYRCQYFEIFRRNVPLKDRDGFVDFGLGIDLEYPVVINKDYVRVICRFGSKLVYNSTLLKVTFPSSQILKRVLPSSGKHPSIFILGFDSTSRLNFLRQMKKTSKFMEETLEGVYMKGLNKVGVNTKPNIGVFLTGKYVFSSTAIYAPGLKEIHPLEEFWDDYPFVWKDFARNGFATMFSEDADISTFKFRTKGFKEIPTDYYCRPFFLAMETLYGYDVNNHCFDGIPKHKYFLPYFQDFVSMFNGKRYFSFNFITDYSHDYINSLQYLDEDVWEMLSKLHYSGALENTIVILLGDHGNRYDKIRQTVVGRFEERMPLFIISLPESLKKEYPHLQENLRNNSETLLSWFDMYELLMDVATGNFEEKSKVKRYGFLGLSPFRKISNHRTCFEIGIPQEFCICNEESDVRIYDWNVKMATESFLNYLNSRLPPVCEMLDLRQIISVHIIKPNSGFVIPHGLSILYRLVIEVGPSKAILEGHVKRSAWSSEVVGQVSRLNRYGNQSHCVEDELLRKFCFCKDMMSTIS